MARAQCVWPSSCWVTELAKRPFTRQSRVSDHLLRELALLVTRELADPRIKPATLTGIEVAKDLRTAKVYVAVAEGSDVAACLAALGKAAGFLRHRLGELMHIRRVPALSFVYDETLDRASRVDALLAAAMSSTAEKLVSLATVRKNRAHDLWAVLRSGN